MPQERDEEEQEDEEENGEDEEEENGEDDEEQDQEERDDGEDADQEERDDGEDADQEERDDGEQDEEVTYAGQDAAPVSSHTSITAAKEAFQEVVLLVQEGRVRRDLRPLNIAAGTRALVAAGRAALADQKGDGKVDYKAPLNPAVFEALLKNQTLDGTQWSVEAMDKIRAHTV
ncbi:unnamed protein product [Tilletia caries]|nr:unnamed protein product [Tilletia caries]